MLTPDRYFDEVRYHVSNFEFQKEITSLKMFCNCIIIGYIDGENFQTFILRQKIFFLKKNILNRSEKNFYILPAGTVKTVYIDDYQTYEKHGYSAEITELEYTLGVGNNAVIDIDISTKKNWELYIVAVTKLSTYQLTFE